MRTPLSSRPAKRRATCRGLPIGRTPLAIRVSSTPLLAAPPGAGTGGSYQSRAGLSSRGDGGRMRIGLFGINTGACARPETAARVARAAEAAGFESVWTGEHVVLPDPQAPPSPVPPDHPMLDPAVALAFLAAHTTRLRLGTGIVILPQRNPVVLAKELASL